MSSIMIDPNELNNIMYHNAFEIDSDMQKWDSGCWIRYKMFENAMKEVQKVDVEPEEAEPIRQGYLHDVYQIVSGEILGVCSECGEEVPVRIRGNYVKYCSNCGAKMTDF